MVKTRSKSKKTLKKENIETRWKIGTYVWGSMNKVYWAGIIVCHKELHFKAPSANRSWIFWFGDYRVSQIRNTDIFRFDTHFNLFSKQKRKSISNIWRKGVLEAIREYGLPKTSTYTTEQLLNYAEIEFSNANNKHFSVTSFVHEKLQLIKDKNKNDNSDPEDKIGASSEIKEVLKLIMNGTKDIRDICLACYTTDVVDDHPLFYGCICMDCKNKIRNTFYVIGDDNIKYFCAVCACLGNMIVCSTRGCGLVYCSKCLDDLCIPRTRYDILKQDPWFCFICDHNNCNGLLNSRRDWKNRVQLLFCNSSPIINRPSLPKTKKPIRVLSLFDGIATGLTALIKLNITVECYYSCEIDQESISVVKKNYPSGITLLGDIRSLTEDDIKNILPIDLLIGGSPCNDLSLANPYRKGLYDPDGSGILFFEFYRILTNLQMYNSQSFFWFYENVASMSIQSRVSITRFLQSEPQLIDAAWVSSQSRPRLFWGNLPTLQNQQFVNDGPSLQHYLMPGRKATVEKLRTVTTRTNSLKQGTQMEFPILNCSNLEDSIDIIELEEIFGFPRNYTKVENLSRNSRQKLLGRAWSVQTICMLFRFLQDYFEQCE